MNSDRIKQIQETTAYPQSVSVKQALLQVWNECKQEQLKKHSIPDVSNSVCLSEKAYSDCHIHADSIFGCLDCGNFKKQND